MCGISVCGIIYFFVFHGRQYDLIGSSQERLEAMVRIREETRDLPPARAQLTESESSISPLNVPCKLMVLCDVLFLQEDVQMAIWDMPSRGTVQQVQWYTRLQVSSFQS